MLYGRLRGQSVSCNTIRCPHQLQLRPACETWYSVNTCALRKRVMKKSVSILLALSLAFVAVALGYSRGRIDGRNAALIAEFKKYSINMLTLTQWETNHPPELKDFVKAHYYHFANRIPKGWVGIPKDFGAVNTNISTLTVFKESNAHLEYQDFLARFPDAKPQTPSDNSERNVSPLATETSENPTDPSTLAETNLNAEQRKLLEEMSLKVKTGN